MSSATKALFGQISRGRSLPILSRFAPAESKTTTRAELAGFRRAQRLAFDCAIAAAQAVEPGWTELETAEWMEAYLREHGVTSCFHRPLAWFGERSRFKGFKKAADACPGESALKAGEVITLDLAPVVGGYVGDVGFSFAREPHAKLAEVRAFLRGMRGSLVRDFGSSLTTEQIWQVTGYIQTLGAYSAKTAAPSRDDGPQTRPAENRAPAAALFDKYPEIR